MLKRGDALLYEQLALGLEVEEEGFGGASPTLPEEVRRRSEAARMALEGTTLTADLTPTPALPLPREERRDASQPREERRDASQPRESVGVLRKGEGKKWLEPYWELRHAGWPWRVAAYIAWQASPKKTRWPETQDALATEVLGLTSDRVIATWRKKNPVIDEVVALMQASPLFAHRRDIYEALVASATTADYKSHPDRKLALEMLGDYVPRQKVEVGRSEVEDLSQLSDEELDMLARGILGKKTNEEGEDG